jgi:hypothetical protein
VMLDLHIQPTSEEIHQIVICSYIMRCKYLVDEKVFRKLFIRMWRQMIYLR